MRTIAILAPTTDGLTPDKFERAQNAMLQQMMLLARGLPVTHPAVRAAAEIVGSAIAADPLEFAIAAHGHRPTVPEEKPKISARSASSDSPAAPAAGLDAAPHPVRLSSPTPPPTETQSRRDEAYARYLATIYASQPSPARKSGDPRSSKA